MTVLSLLLKILAALSLLLGLAQVTAGFLKVELFKLPALHLKLIGAGLVVVAGVLGTTDYLVNRKVPTPPSPFPPPGGNQINGPVTGGGDVIINQQIVEKLEIREGDTEERKAQKREQAQRIVAQLILTDLRHIDHRLLVLDSLAAPDEVESELESIRRRVAPALQQVGHEGYRKLMAEQRAASLQQAFNGAPLRTDQGEAMVRLLQETEVVPALVIRFNEAVDRVSEASQRVVEATRAPATAPSVESKEVSARADRLQAEQMRLALSGLSNQGQIAHVHGLLALNGLALDRVPIDADLSSLSKLSPRHLISQEEAAALLTALTQTEEERVRRKAALLDEYKLAVRGTLDAYAAMEGQLRIAPSDGWELVVAKAVSLRQLGRTGEAVAAFAQYGRMFRDRDKGAEHYSQIAQQFTVQMEQLDVGGGVYAYAVGPRGPAARAGLQLGDIVIEVAGKPTPDMVAFTDALSRVATNASVQLICLRLHKSGRFTRHHLAAAGGPLSAGFMPI